MAVISSFFGIYTRMYFADHAAPHIHVDYHGNVALVANAEGTLVEGELARRAMTLVRQWCLDHRAEQEQNWTRAQALQPLSSIPGADYE